MFAFFSFVLVLHLACAQEPKILFDGRIPQGTAPSAFDYGDTAYQAMGVRPENQTWSDVITTESMLPSLFDGEYYQSFQMTFTDETVFKPNPGFIRAHLKPNTSKAENFTVGVTTFHFSVQRVVDAPLNKTHQYELIFLESETNRRHIFELRYGTNYTGADPVEVDEIAANLLRIQSSSVDGMKYMEPIFEVDFAPYVFHNFAVTIDWNEATIAVYYSQDDQELQLVVYTQANAVKTPASLNVGLLKVPVGPSSNPAMEGFQEKGITESVIYGGIFVEDSSYGIVTTKPAY